MSLFFGVLAVIGVVLGCVLVFIPDRAPGKSFGEKPIPQLSVPESVSPPADQAGKSEAVIAVLLAIVNSPDHTSRCEHIIGRSAMHDRLESHYGREGRLFPTRIINPSVTAIETNNREILLVSFINESGKRISAPFEWDGDAYRLHWEAMTGYGDVPWETFFNERPQGVYEMRANLYLPREAGDLPENAERITALLSHPELPKPRTVAIPVGSEAHRQLLALPPDTDIPAHIGIQWMEGDVASLPIVSRWLHRDWIRP